MTAQEHAHQEHVQEQARMQEALSVIQHTLDAVGCHTPAQLIDHGTAIRVGVYDDNVVVRFYDGHWKVSEYTPYLQSVSSYRNLNDCAYDIAMCKPGVQADPFFQRVREVGYDS